MSIKPVDRSSIYRGDGVDRPKGLALPPGRMPRFDRRRPLKQWAYAGVFGDSVMLCAGVARVAGVPQAFWAVWDRERRLLDERTILLRTAPVSVAAGEVRVTDTRKDVHLALTLEPAGEPIEVISRHDRSYIWTRKTPICARGDVVVGSRTIAVDAAGLVDESAGYHARHTAWQWSAGVGTATDGRPVTWNLVRGLHDAPVGSERVIWVDGKPHEVGPSEFADGLGSVTYPEGSLAFAEEAARRRTDRMVVMSSDYVQPFGTFTGEILPGITLTGGFGVMERHRATW